MDCSITTEHYVDIDFIEAGMTFKWEVTSNNASIIGPDYESKVTISTSSSETKVITLTCTVTTLSGVTKVASKEVTHKRVKFNPAIADPYGENRNAVLASFNNELTTVSSGDPQETRDGELTNVSGIPEFYECKNSKYAVVLKETEGYQSAYGIAGDNVSTCYEGLMSFLFILDDVGNLASGDKSTIASLTYPSEDSAFIGYTKVDSDKNLYIRVRVYTGDQKTVTLVSERDGTSYSHYNGPFYVEHLIGNVDDFGGVGTPLSIVAGYSGVDDIYYIYVNGTLVDRLICIEGKYTIFFAGSISASAFQCRFHVNYNPSDTDAPKINGKIANVRYMYNPDRATKGIFSKFDFEMMSLELNNCELI
jgi:hypothetical protein